MEKDGWRGQISGLEVSWIWFAGPEPKFVPKKSVLTARTIKDETTPPENPNRLNLRT